MRYASLIIASILFFSGCTPKIGEDIFIEPQGNIRLESSQTEVILGVLSLLGVRTKSGDIRLGSDLMIRNQWHSDITLVSLEYTLTDGVENIVRGEVKKDPKAVFIVASGEEKIIPLEFRFDAQQLNSNRVLRLLDGKKKMFIRGEAVLKIWGIEKRHPFEKEVTQVIRKALKGA
jgi:hypothetical protein